jgi:hypothetical protein
MRGPHRFAAALIVLALFAALAAATVPLDVTYYYLPG